MTLKNRCAFENRWGDVGKNVGKKKIGVLLEKKSDGPEKRQFCLKIGDVDVLETWMDDEIRKGIKSS